MKSHDWIQRISIAGLCVLLLSASPALGEIVSYTSGASPIFGDSVQYGDTLLFSPTAFSSSSSGANGVNMTDGLLRVWITSAGDISDVVVNEGGACFFFGGRPTDLTKAYVGANAAQLFITSVNGAPVTGPLISIAGTMQYTPSSADVGSRTFYATDPVSTSGWQGTMVFQDPGAALARTPYAGGSVTGVMLVFDNILATASEAGTLAYIDKKWVSITADPTPASPTPEPGTLTLLATVSLVGLVFATRKRGAAA
ncbi:MAG: PEP-CTERM sorting domain-containing protein [Planctomycetaceae bacterium]|nr:PEP-CTERM sorting domain-containing protein [Planctomycetaceae bacterium]